MSKPLKYPPLERLVRQELFQIAKEDGEVVLTQGELLSLFEEIKLLKRRMGLLLKKEGKHV